MDKATLWWMQNTPQGRRLYERVMPRGAIPPPMRRQMCRERGHETGPDGVCRRCGQKEER